MITEAFAAIAELASARGAKNIHELPGCWEQRVDDQWSIFVNGHDEPVACSQGTKVPPYSALLMFNGWPAGVIDPGGGIIAASNVANENAFIAACKAAAQAPA